MHGGVAKTDLSEENVQAVRDGFANLKRHVENVRKFGLQQSLLLTSLLLIQTLKLQPLRNFVQKSMFLLNWLAFGLMVLMVVLTLPTQ